MFKSCANNESKCIYKLIDLIYIIQRKSTIIINNGLKTAHKGVKYTFRVDTIVDRNFKKIKTNMSIESP